MVVVFRNLGRHWEWRFGGVEQPGVKGMLITRLFSCNYNMAMRQLKAHLKTCGWGWLGGAGEPGKGMGVFAAGRVERMPSTGSLLRSWRIPNGGDILE